MMTFCTLFNVTYLDKGLVLYGSLENVVDDFKLYVLAMDDRCYEILCDLQYTYLHPIKLEDFEDDELLEVKKTRSFGEYCWTCSSSLVLYVLKKYNPDYCTYIDADMFFYSDPSVIISEMESKNSSVQIIGHRFNDEDRKEQEFRVGKYCVEFNTFKNDEKALSLLDIWRSQCLKQCSEMGNGIVWGDQKYQDNWLQDFDFVMETQNAGAGVAPWNIKQYLHGSENELFHNGKRIKLIFFHFENIEYVSACKVRTNIPHIHLCDMGLVKWLYVNYLRKIAGVKQELKDKYELDIIVRYHPARIKNDNVWKCLSNPFAQLKKMVKDSFYLIDF